MKYKKINIETDGTSAGTKVFIDKKQIDYVQNIDFSADVNEVFARINIQMGYSVDGELKFKNKKVRDEKTQKFIEKREVKASQLILERET